MATYTLQTDTLRTAAERLGDKSLYRIHKRTGIDLTVLSRITRGENAPSVDTLVRLAKTYGIAMEALITPLAVPVAA